MHSLFSVLLTNRANGHCERSPFHGAEKSNLYHESGGTSQPERTPSMKRAYLVVLTLLAFGAEIGLAQHRTNGNTRSQGGERSTSATGTHETRTQRQPTVVPEPPPARAPHRVPSHSPHGGSPGTVVDEIVHVVEPVSTGISFVLPPAAPPPVDVLVRDVELTNSFHEPDAAGYDFSDRRLREYDHRMTDISYECGEEGPLIVVQADTRIRDAGWSESLNEFYLIRDQDWEPSGVLAPVAGRTYVVRTWEGGYARVRVTSVSSERLVFDWRAVHPDEMDVTANKSTGSGFLPGFSERTYFER